MARRVVSKTTFLDPTHWDNETMASIPVLFALRAKGTVHSKLAGIKGTRATFAAEERSRPCEGNGKI